MESCLYVNSHLSSEFPHYSYSALVVFFEGKNAVAINLSLYLSHGALELQPFG